MKIKILSWNIWMDGNFDKISSFLKNVNADIIGLQEVKNNDPKRDFIKYLKSLDYQYVFASVKHSWGGNDYFDGPAIFCRYPIVDSATYVLSKREKRAAARADILIVGKEIHIINTHLIHTHQQPSIIQEKQAKNLLNLLPQEQTILMGDFNALPESETINIIKTKLSDADKNNLPTWCIDPRGCPVCNTNKVVHKLDYIFTSRDMKAFHYKVEQATGSDHLPISVMIEL